MSPLRRAVDALVVELRARSKNAARRNKPTMWAYYADMAQWLGQLAAGLPDDQLESVLYGYGITPATGPGGDPLTVARLWSQGIYARRALARAGLGGAKRPSLAWLRERAG